MSQDATPFRALEVPLHGVVLVEASAGTGKTHAVTTLLLRALVELKLAPREILATTYTRAGAAEMRQRLRDRVGRATHFAEGNVESTDAANLDDESQSMIQRLIAERGQRAVVRTLWHALRHLDELDVTTIHGVCQRVIMNHALSLGVDPSFELHGSEYDNDRREAARFVTTLSVRLPRSVFAYLGTSGLSVEKLAEIRTELPKPNPLQCEDAPCDREARLESLLVHGRAIDDVCAAALALLHSIRDELPADDDRIVASFGAAKTTKNFTLAIADLRASLTKIGDNPLHALKSCIDIFGAIPKRMAKSDLDSPDSQPNFLKLLRDASAIATDAIEKFDAFFDNTIREFVTWLREEARSSWTRDSAIGYDDLISMMWCATRDHRGPITQQLREQYRFVVIDEFQDTDPEQYDIFQSVFAPSDDSSIAAPGTCMVLVGDPKQGIFGFRGADVFAFERARRRGATRTYTLQTNWRSTPEVVASLNALYAHWPRPFGSASINYVPVTSAREGDGSVEFSGTELVEVADADGNTPKVSSLATAVADEVVFLLETEKLEPHEIAILVRSAIRGRECEVELAKRGVSVQLHRSTSVLASPTAIELATLIDAIARPTSSSRARGVMLTQFAGGSIRERVEASQNSSDVEEMSERLFHAHGIAQRRGVTSAILFVLNAIDARVHLASARDGDRLLVDLDHLLELLGEHESNTNESLERVRDWFIGRADVVDDEYTKARPMSAGNAVQVLTMHAAKGLEFGVVVTVGATAGHRSQDSLARMFYDEDLERRELAILSSASPQNTRGIKLANQQEIDESHRLIYVALTRARTRNIFITGVDPSKSDAASAKLGISSVQTLHAIASAIDDHELEPAAARSLRRRAPRTKSILQPIATPKSTFVVRASSRTFRTEFTAASYTALAREEHAPSFDSSDVIRADESVSAQQDSSTHARRLDDEPTLPRGARTGTMVHELFELHAFTSLDDPGLEIAEAESILRRHGFSTSLTPQLVSLAASSVRAPLWHLGPSLRDIPPQATLKELPFTMHTGGTPVRSRDLAKAFDRSFYDVESNDYASRLRTLVDQRVDDYLRGSIDLVFEHEGRWSVLDYKTNDLGMNDDAYGYASMLTAMEEHHYLLQASLYGVALHRHLKVRLPTYDPQQHLGRVVYMFCRGTTQSRRAEDAVFTMPISPRHIAKLDLLLGWTPA